MCRRNWIAAATIALLGALPYLQILAYPFISYDDPIYIYENPIVTQGFSMEGVRYAFQGGHGANWHPLTTLSHMADCALFGLRSPGHHAVNLFLHALDSVLLFVALLSLSRSFWPAAAVAALFAVHPLHVESVAWAASRKDLLSALFWILAMWSYARYVRNPSLARYALVAIMMTLGLMSKPMVVTLPCALLLLDYWPLGRLEHATWRARVWCLVEKLPLFSLSVASSALTAFSQSGSGAIATFEYLPMAWRLENAAYSYALYLRRVFVPIDLAVFYPHPMDTLSLLAVSSSITILAAITSLAVWQAKRRPYLIVGWLWFLGVLTPVIGLVQVGSQGMADRYMYLPIIGIFIMLVWAAADLASALRGHKAMALVGAVVVAGLLGACAMQVRVWRSSEDLFRHALAATENNAVAHGHLGMLLSDKGEFGAAEEHLIHAVRLSTRNPQYFHALGILYSRMGRLEEAERAYREAMLRDGHFKDAAYNLGLVLSQQNKIEESIEWYTRALQIAPAMTRARANRGVAEMAMGRYSEAIADFEQALLETPGEVILLANAGTANLLAGNYQRAAFFLEQAVKIRPADPALHLALGLAYSRQGDVARARSQLETVLRIAPDNAEARQELEKLHR